MNKTSKIYVAGHNGLVGSSIVRKLKEERYKNILTFNREELDLTDKSSTETMFRLYKPTYVFLTAAKVGGIHANNIESGEYFYDNIMIQTNVIEAAKKYGVKKLLFLASSSVYPKESFQPIKEEYLLSSYLDPIKSPYVTAKISGIEMCKAYRKQWGCNFISAISCNLYGPNDNFSLTDSHVIPAFIRKFYDAKINGIPQVEVWGDGSPNREFMYVDDLADALYFLMKNYDTSNHINVGSKIEVPIGFIAKMIKDIIEYEGDIIWNQEMPNGTLRKLLDSSKIEYLGWKSSISLEKGIKKTIKWFIQNYKNIRK